MDEVRWFDVDILDTENRISTYSVQATNEEDAGEYAWVEASQNYHGPKTILEIS